MKKTRRSAFTIVELVIVIAVIAILSAVLIPTFGGIIESANRSVDTMLVANINTILAVEDITGGGVNDAVEIQRIVEENGLKLETKSKGALILYDKKNNRAVLGTLDESGDGIIIAKTTSGTSSDVAKTDDGPALISAVADNSVADNSSSASNKVPFRTNITKLEQIFDSYLMITTKSSDGLAEAICGLRNANDADEIADNLAKIKEVSPTLGANLDIYMGNTVVVNASGELVSTNTDNTAKYVLVNSGLTEVSATLINNLNSYTNVDLVEFHSNITTFDAETLAAMDESTKTYIYDNDSGANAADNIFHISDRGDVVKTVFLQNKIDNVSNGDPVELDEINLMNGTCTIDLPYGFLDSTDAKTAYKFEGYSFSEADEPTVLYGAENYELSEYEKNNAADGKLVIYAQYTTQTPTFKMGDYYYENSAMTYLLSKGDVSGTVTVVSTTAKLDASLIGKNKAELTIPSGVELLLPYKDNAKQTWTITAGSGDTKYNADNYKSNAKYDKETMTGKTNLTIAGNVQLKIESGANLYVDAACYNNATSYQCYITDNCGVMVLEAGSEIISSGNITAYGVIRGDGTITTNGGTVTELMTLYDWYGGTNASNAVPKNITPFNKWKIEHITVEKMTINHPTQYKTQSGITYRNSITDEDVAVSIDDFTLAGPSSSSPLFATTDGTTIERSVSENGNMKFTIAKGSVVDNAKTLSFQVTMIGSVDVDFTKMSLPISNMDIVVGKDTDVTISNNIYKIMPGSSIMVDKGAVLNIGTKVVVCNSFDLEFEETSGSKDYTGDLLAGTTDEKYSYSVVDSSKLEGTNSKGQAYSTIYAAYGNVVKFNYTYKTRTENWWGPVFTGYTDWSSEKTETIYLTNPRAFIYNGYDAAELVVNGTLNLNGGAFAGNITSTQSGATINVNADIGGHEIEEGYYIQNSKVGDRWYDLYDPDMYKVPVLAGTAIEDGLKSGTTYTSNAGTVAGKQFCQWQ